MTDGIEQLKIELTLDLLVQNETLLKALRLAEPVLDAASATADERGNTMITGARPAWNAVKAAIAAAEGEQE